MRAFELPSSTFFDREAREALQQRAELQQAVGRLCHYESSMLAQTARMVTLRKCYDEHFHARLIAQQRARFNVDISSRTIGGVHTETFVAVRVIPAKNRRRVLINLHGGGFVMGARSLGRIESIPIAAESRMKVVSIDYRLAPEHSFPAATEDVVKVYRAILETHEPHNVGIYGCSAGALLTAQTAASLQNAGLPLPGALGMFCGGGSYFGEGDSGHFHAARSGLPLEQLSDPAENPYFKNVDRNDPGAFPVRSDKILAAFPPSLFATATRDFALSSVAHMHSRLVALGVRAELHVWEGVDHAFLHTPELPQSRELYALTAKFFAEHLSA